MASNAISMAASDLLQSQRHYRDSAVVFDSISQQAKIPRAFVWPSCEVPPAVNGEFQIPVVDLGGFFKGDEVSTQRAVDTIRTACLCHGFFQVINHKVDMALSRNTFDVARKFFSLPLQTKFSVPKQPDSPWGYATAHAERFSSKLPWKETLTFCYDYSRNGEDIVDYFTSRLGEEYQAMGRMYQKYCEAMKELGFSIFELLATSLGLGRSYFRDFFEDGSSTMRCNNYPPCQEPELTLGTGPHSDPTGLTILQQEDVAGLEVLAGETWQYVNPIPGALVINIGDTFMALTNGIYKSCLHRAAVNKESARLSVAFFMVPRGDKAVRPPRELLLGGDDIGEQPRAYPDFTWSELLKFTQTQHRADITTLQHFTDRLSSVAHE